MFTVYVILWHFSIFRLSSHSSAQSLPYLYYFVIYIDLNYYKYGEAD